MSDNTYPEHPRSKVKRLAARGAYDYETIHRIIDACPVLHVSFVPDGTDPFPAILPMIGALGSFVSPETPHSSGPLDLYLHGWVSARLMRLARTPDDEQGLPVCVAGTQVDGYVLALSPFHSSMNYRSAVLHGYITVVQDPQETLYAMELITNRVVPGRWAHARSPPLKSELDSTAIMKVQIESASAKIRIGGANEDRSDVTNDDIRGKFWSGIVPTWPALGDPISAEGNRVEVPAHIEDWISAKNTGGLRYAREVAMAATPRKA